MPEDLDPLDVEELRRRVVDPVVMSLVHPDEFEEVSVTVVEDDFARQRELFPWAKWPSSPARYLRVAVKARGEWISCPQSLWAGDAVDDHPLVDAERLAADLYDGLRDELTESRLSWGEWRDGDYEVLGPRQS
jgi:hypothetical protein